MYEEWYVPQRRSRDREDHRRPAIVVGEFVHPIRYLELPLLW